MEMARNVIRSRVQDMSDSEYNAMLRDLMRTADNDVEAGKIKTMYDKMRAAGESAPSATVRKKARGGKIKGYRYGTPKGGVKACRGRKANYKA